MSNTEVKNDRRYTKDHEWALVESDEIVVGITAFAVDQLGDITLVNLDVRVGDELEEHAVFGTIESVKTLSDLFSPIAGTVTRLNPALENQPELINDDCWKEGWMIAIKPRAMADLDRLLDPEAYRAALDQRDD
jgi:glycine cleavage system H protein